MLFNVMKWTLVIEQDKEVKIDFESSCHPADVKKTARRVARNRGINLNNVKYQVNRRG